MFLRLIILVGVPLLVLWGHGSQARRFYERMKRSADGTDVPDATAERTGHSSVLLWFVCYVGALVLALGRAFLGSPLGLIALLGAGVMAAGVVVRRKAMTELGEWFDEFIVARRDQPVVDTGLFARCRHPLHKGLVLEILGLALINGHPAAFFLFAVAAIWFFVRGVEEERALVKGLGAPYRDYLRRVPSLIDYLPAGWRRYAEDPTGDERSPGPGA